MRLGVSPFSWFLIYHAGGYDDITGDEYAMCL